MAVNGSAPSAETVDAGEYPLARPLFIYSDAKVMAEKPQVAAFINFYLSSVNDLVPDYMTAPSENLFVLPPGFTIRPAGGAAEAEAWVVLHRAAFGTERMELEERLAMLAEPEYDPQLDLVAVAPDGSDIYLFAEGVIDMAQERRRLEKELEQTRKRLEGTRRKLANADFTGKAPADVVERERRSETELAEKVEALERALAAM